MPRPTWAGTVRRVRGWLSKPFVRVGVQMWACTVLVMAVTSPSQVWAGLSLDPVVANPALVLLLCYLNILFSVGAGLAALQVAAESVAGNCLGAGLGVGIAYAAFAINGASRANTPARAAPTLCLSAVVVFVHTVMRFRFRRYNQFWMLSIVALALTIGVSYHAPYALYRFAVHWMWYAILSSAALLVVMTVVLPLPAGGAVRGALAAALRELGRAMAAGLDLMTGELDAETGLLAACSGDTSARVGIDGGLWDAGLETLYTDVYAAGTSIATVWKWEAAARLEFDLYRRQHRFPARAFDVLALTARSMLSSFMMVVYPLQTGRQNCRVMRAHAGELRALGGAMRACCEGLADVLQGRRRLRDELAALNELEARFEALTRKAGEGGVGDAGGDGIPSSARLSTDALAFRLLIATLRTLCTRLCQMHLSAVEALGRDDPGAGAELAAHLGLGGPRQRSKVWGLVPRLAARALRGEGPAFEGPVAAASSAASSARAPLSFLRNSVLLASAPGRTSASFLAFLDAQHTVLKVLPVVEARPSAARRLLDALRRATGVTTNHLSVGVQGVVGYCVIMVMVIVPASNDAFDKRMLWGLLIVITILEQVSGQVVLKGVQRLLGTALGAGLGVGIMYLTYLCNGLSYSSAHVQKYILLPLFLSLSAGVVGACAVRFARWFYAFLIAAIIMAVVSLPNYHEDEPLPKTAVWRLAATAVGVVVNVILAACLFPVTARAVYEAQMASALEGLAGVMNATVHSLVPREHRRARHRRRGAVPQVSLDGAGRDDAGRQRAVLRSAEHGARSEEGGGDEGGEEESTGLRRTTLSELFQVGDRVGSASLSPALSQGSLTALRHEISLPAHGRGRAGDGAAALQAAYDAEDYGAALDGPLASHDNSNRSIILKFVAALRHLDPSRRCRRGASSLLQSPSSKPAQAIPNTDLARTSSLYVTLEGAGTCKLVGGAYLRVQPRLKQIGATIAAMTTLDQALHYEYYPFSKVKRFPFAQAQRAQRLCRQLLNVAGSFSAALDAHDTYSCPLLIPVAPELADVSAQLEACLLALAGVVRGTVLARRAADMIANLDDLTRHLFLRLIAHSTALEETGPDAVLCVTFLAMLFNGAYVMRLLCVALTRAFVPGDEAAQAAVDALAVGTRWAVDEQIMVLCNDLMASAMLEEEGVAGGVAGGGAANAERPGAEPGRDAASLSNPQPAPSPPTAAGLHSWESELAAMSRASFQPS